MRAVGLSSWLALLGVFVPLAGALAGAAEGPAAPYLGVVAGVVLWTIVLKALRSERRPLPPVIAATDEPAPEGEASCAAHKNRVLGTCMRCGDFVCRACAHPGPGLGWLVCTPCGPVVYVVERA